MRTRARTDALCLASESAQKLHRSCANTYGDCVVTRAQDWVDLRGVDSGFCQDLWRLVSSAAVGAPHR